jgi:putative ATP-binding cassette transporter
VLYRRPRGGRPASPCSVWDSEEYFAIAAADSANAQTDAASAKQSALVTRVFIPTAIGYWKGPTKLQAWGLLLGLGCAVLGAIGANIGLSMWNRWFFDALEQKDAAEAVWSLFAFFAIALGSTAANVCLVLSRETIQVRWRAWISKLLFEKWLNRRRFYHLNATAGDDEATVPEYRISDDVRWATEPVMDFYISLLGAVVSIISFTGILWVVGGSLTVGNVTIPAYLVICGLLHAGILTTLMLYCGRALPRNLAARQEAEAHFRLSLMRVRENAESIAMTRGENGERIVLTRDLGELAKRWLAVVRQNGQLTWILHGNGMFLNACPLLLALPKYLTGDLSLGAVMQIASAYVPFQIAFGWAVENYRTISTWRASARRVGHLIEALDDVDRDLDREGLSDVAVGASDDGKIHVENLTVTSRQGMTMIRDANVVIEPGQKVLLTGESGTGKSAMARAIAGLWPWGSGSVKLPAEGGLSFVPQRAYLPLGTLRDSLRYPQTDLNATDGAIVDAMVRYGIGHLAPRLDQTERWDQLLSNGERQRVAFVRLVLQKPDVAILDDALAALGDAAQGEIMTMLREDLPGMALINVATHAGMERFHDRSLVLIKAEGGSQLHAPEPTGPVLVAIGPTARTGGAANRDP